jgi:hypothetical protein
VKTGLKTYINNKLFLLILLIYSDLPAQIPLNGFCRYNRISVDSGYQALFPMNFNNDPYTDLILFNPARRNLSLIQGDSINVFKGKNQQNFKYRISELKNLSYGDIYSRSHIFVSRKDRTAGVINFNETGNIYILDEIKFQSYPERIDVSDIDNDKALEALISGPSFDGLSMLQINKGKIKESVVVKGVSYKDAVFTNLDSDNFPDIAALNIFSYSIDLYLNNSRGEFRFSRSISTGSLPYSFSSTDIDLDYYDDIIWGEKGKVIISYGSPVFPFEEETELTARYNPHLFVTGDFNRDGHIDLIYADTTSGIIAAFFATEERHFAEELILFQKKDAVSIAALYSKFFNGIAVLGKDGSLYLINEALSISEEINLIAGIKPGAVNYFDFLNNGITDICYIDENIPSINFIIRNSEGVPEKVYQYKLHSVFREITVDNSSKETKSFYCWTKGEKLIEIIQADFKQNRFKKNSIYASGKIEDLKIQTIANRPAIVHVSYRNNGGIGINVFEYHDFRYVKADYKDFALNVENISSFVAGREKGVFTWQKRDRLGLYFHNIKEISKQQRVGEILPGEVLLAYNADIFNNELPSQISYIKRDTTILIVTAGKRINLHNHQRNSFLSERDQFYSYERKLGGLRQLMVYIYKNKSLNRITLFNKGKDLILSELISGINVNRYFIRNMSLQNYHIVYSDSEENCITIRRIQ